MYLGTITIGSSIEIVHEPLQVIDTEGRTMTINKEDIPKYKSKPWFNIIEEYWTLLQIAPDGNVHYHKIFKTLEEAIRKAYKIKWK